MAHTVTVATPLPDSNRDGRVTITSMAAKLGVPRGTVLTRCGATVVYVGPKVPCPAAADPWAIHAPVASRGERLTIEQVAVAAAIPAFT